jgi:methylphosphotriester-DNA--protein-cysteine methyltransferase
MIYHSLLGAGIAIIKANVFCLIKNGKVQFGGNKKLKIYGTLHCKSGKRMKMENRVFFRSEPEARQAGYRPCGHCMPAAYREWKLSYP